VYVVYVAKEKWMRIRISSEERALLHDLSQRGIALDATVLRDLDVGNSRFSVIQHESLGNKVFDLDAGGAGYLFELSIYNTTRRFVRITEIHLQMPWEEPYFRWLPRPLKGPGRGYCFPAPGEQGIDPRIVINHRIGERITPGGLLEGFLLGIGESPIPESYRDRTRIAVCFSMFDGRDDPCSVTLNLRVHRKPSPRVKQSDITRREPLFSVRDDQ
jgi:hypothetical protein